MTILDTIIAEKRKEVQQLRGQSFKKLSYEPIDKTFAQQIRSQQTMGIIAEIKRASPSKGMIHADVHPADQAKMYAKHGANAISVLTDTPFFKGTFNDLQDVRQAVHIPILCKDFIIDEIQIDQAEAAGANIILLIAAALSKSELNHLYEYATKRNLEVICEVNNETEMQDVLSIGATLIGINNRDLKTFEVDLQTTNRLAHMINHEDVILIGESGIATPSDVVTLADAGAEVVLVGETFMRASNIEETMTSFQVPLPNHSRQSSCM